MGIVLNYRPHVAQIEEARKFRGIENTRFRETAFIGIQCCLDCLRAAALQIRCGILVEGCNFMRELREDIRR